jgi:D-3-phosphoglycerate dehydrogenase
MDVFVSTAPFGEADSSTRLMLDESDYSVQYNKTGRKLIPEELAELASEAKVVIAGTEKLSCLLGRNQNLQMISRVGVGLDGVPLNECKKRGIRVSWTPDAVTPAVSELTIGLMIGLTRYINLSDRYIRSGGWKRPVGKRIGESVIGLAGFGRIGNMVAKLLVPFGPQKVLISDNKDKSAEVFELRKVGLDIDAVPIEQLFRESDIVSLHLPNSPATFCMVNAKTIASMKEGSFLINTSRGELIDENDLASALTSYRLGGAALDAFHFEPYSGPLRNINNVLLTPHLGSCAMDCRAQMEREAAVEALRFLRGEPLLQEVPFEEYTYQIVQGDVR